MKGIILAGGFATRLRPLSCSKPKLLFPLVGVPLIDYMVQWLGKGGVEDVILAVNHLAEKLRYEVESRKLSSRVVLSIEDKPLGTAGPLRLASPLLEREAAVVVANGDVVSNIDVNGLIAAHLRSGAAATVAVFSVKDPRPFGLATVDSKDRIIGFEEKSRSIEGPGLINAGVYVLNKNVVQMIPAGRSVSLEHEIFPLLAKQMKMIAWRHTGFWFDIGKIRDYVEANRELLVRPDSGMLMTRTMQGSVDGVEDTSFLGEGCRIDSGARVGPFTILSPRVKVGPNTKIRNSIVFEDTSLGEDCIVDDSVIGERVTIGGRVRIGEGSIVAGQISIPDGTIVDPGSTILN